MNKSLKFLAISLLMVPALARAQDTTTSWRARIYGFFVNQYTTEFAKGLAAGVASEFVIDTARACSSETKLKFRKDEVSGQVKLVLGQAGLYGLDWAQANTDGMSFQGFGLRTAGILVGSHGLKVLAGLRADK